MYLIGIIMIFGSLCLFIIGLNRWIMAKRRRIARRLEQFSNISADVDGRKTTLLNNELRDGRNEEGESKGFLNRYMDSIELELLKADLLLRPSEFIMMAMAFSLMMGLVFFVLIRTSMMFLFGFVLGVVISKIFINIKKSRRIIKLNQQLTDTISLISNGLKVGNSFFQAAEMVARDMRPPISTEFKKLIHQMNLGMPAEEALKKLAQRVESQDVDLMVTAILIHRQIGGNLAEVLDNITHTIRERVKLKGEIRSKTAEGRLSGIILILLPPSLAFLIYVMSPDFISVLVVNPIGWVIISLAVILQIIGILFIIKIVNIEI